MDCKRIVFLLAMIFSCIEVFSEDVFYRMTEGDSGVEYVQTLTWDEVPYAVSYDVSLEKESSNGEWNHVDSFYVEKNSIELSMDSGQYRYKIAVRNILGKLEPASEWYLFTVLKALEPLITKVENPDVYLSENQDGIILLEAENISEDATVYLENDDGSVLPLSIIKNTTEEVTVQMDENLLEEGDYSLIVKNPGGQETKISALNVKTLPPPKMTLSLGYNLAQFTSGGTITQYFGKELLPAGGNVQFCVFPFNGSFGSVGFGLSMHLFAMNVYFNEYSITGLFLPFSLNGVYQYPILKDRLVLDTHIGFGLTYIHDLTLIIKGESPKYPLKAIGLTPSVGIGLQIFANDGGYIEFGLDYLCSFHIKDSIIQMVVPSFSVGWDF